MHGTPAFIMDVAMVDCVTVALELYFYSTMGYQEKATETICSWNSMVESVAPCMLAYRSLAPCVIGKQTVNSFK